MAFEVITTDQTTEYDIDNGDTVTLMPGVSLTYFLAGFRVRYGEPDIIDSVRLNVLGTVVSGRIGVDFFWTTSGITNSAIVVGSSGVIYAAEAGISTQDGGNNTVINNGTINFGTYGISVGHGGSETTNAVIENHGSLIAARVGENMPSAGIEFSGHDAVVVNTGLISGEVSAALVRLGVYDGGTATLVNSGDIIATNQTAVWFNTSENGSFSNSGFVRGNVNFGSGDDYFDGRGGRVDGTVSGGDGNDTYIIDDATINLSESGGGGVDLVQSSVGWKLGAGFENLTLIGDGNIRGIGNGLKNTINGKDSNNRLRGGAGADTIDGGDGDDKIWGGTGADSLAGGTGDDIIRGGKFKDKLVGGDDDDVLYGNQHNDRLYGGDGNDRLVGGLGRDLLYGGQGEDVFVFSHKKHSLNSANADKIMDFVVGEDVIDLSGLAGDKNYIGSAPFFRASGEVQVIASGGSTAVMVDLDGDGTADMKIIVEGVTGLSDADLLL